MSVTEECPIQFDSRHQWDINDSNMPQLLDPDQYEDWPSGHCKFVYPEESDEARKHSSGWAMRNTNNHNVNILKKSCLGVLVCNRNCTMDNGKKTHLRPAICDKARKKQLGKPCANRNCDGHLELRACGGHCGYPVTHFWRHTNGYIFFQAKGIHDHAQPELKSCAKSKRYYSKSSAEPKKRGVKRSYNRVEVNNQDYERQSAKVQIVDIKPSIDYTTVPSFQDVAQPSTQASPLAESWSTDNTSPYQLGDFPIFDFGVEQSQISYTSQNSQDSGFYPTYSDTTFSSISECSLAHPSFVSTSFSPYSESTRTSNSSPTSCLDESVASSGRFSPTSSTGGDAHSLYSTTDARGPYLDDIDEMGLFDAVDKFTGGFDLNSLLDLSAIESILGEVPTEEKPTIDTLCEPAAVETSPAWGKLVSASRGPSPDHSLSELTPFNSLAPTVSDDIYTSYAESYTESADTLNLFKDLSVNFADIFSC